MKRLLFSLIGLLALTRLAFGATLPLLTGPLDPANLLFYFNSLIQNINNNTTIGTIFLQSSPLTGVTETLTGTTTIDVNLTPAGTIAANTIVFPTTPTDTQQISIFTSATITSLTLTPGSATLTGGVTTLAANASVSYRYQAATTTWFRNR